MVSEEGDFDSKPFTLRTKRGCQKICVNGIHHDQTQVAISMDGSLV